MRAGWAAGCLCVGAARRVPPTWPMFAPRRTLTLPATSEHRLPPPGAALWDMALMAAIRGAPVHKALPLMAGIQAAVAVAVMLLIVPMATARLPVRSSTPATAEA